MTGMLIYGRGLLGGGGRGHGADWLSRPALRHGGGACDAINAQPRSPLLSPRWNKPVTR